MPQALTTPTWERWDLVAGQCGCKAHALFSPHRTAHHPRIKLMKCSGVDWVTEWSVLQSEEDAVNGTGEKMENAEAKCFLMGLLSTEV